MREKLGQQAGAVQVVFVTVDPERDSPARLKTYLAAFDPAGISPAWMHSARGFWSMSTFGLVVAAVSLASLLAWRLRRE